MTAEPAPGRPDLSIIIPAYMEAPIIADSLRRLADFLDSRDYGDVEVIVVVADSVDGTASIAGSQAGRFANFRIHKPGPRVGKGRDVRAGILEATGRYRLFMDADLATPLHHIDEAYAKLKNGAPVVIAVRNLLSIHKDPLRKFMSSFGNIFAQVTILPGIKDTQCGFKGFEASAAEAIFARQTMMGWSFDAEILKIARTLGYPVATFEITDWRDPKTGKQGLVGDSPLGAAVKTFTDIISIRFKAWAGRYRHP
jgi:dolichyl-phosphate beta-glucosyltransferase